jgi:Uma2 family endonuclease
VYSSDLRIRVPVTGLASYADVAVVCGPVETDPDSADTVINPAVLVEVLSPATIDYDLGEKFEHYTRMPSLQAVIFVWQDRRQVEVRERASDATWRSLISTGGQLAAIDSLACRLQVDALYDDAGAP